MVSDGSVSTASARSMVILRDDLDRADVVIDRERWAALAAVGGGVMVEELADRLELDEMGTGRVVKELSDLGLVVFDLFFEQ